MALSSISCLNHHFHPIPISSSRSSPSLTTHFACKEAEEKRSWKRQCMIGVACIIIGLQMEVLLEGEINLAWGMQQQGDDHNIIMASKSKSRVQKWSDKRLCPPWRLNSLETIVPENLPRPSARRRSEAIGNSGKNSVPQVTRTLISNQKNCFSL